MFTVEVKFFKKKTIVYFNILIDNQYNFNIPIDNHYVHITLFIYLFLNYSCYLFLSLCFI